MSAPIEDYALLSNLRCAALVSRAGSIDWFCPGQFDAPACFSALLGSEQHGRWLIAPRATDAQVTRQYQKNTLVLETSFTTATGSVRITDAMPVGDGCHIVRLVECLSGSVAMQMQCNPRFGYGRHKPAARENRNEIIFQWQDDQLRLSACNTFHCGTADASAQFDMRTGEQRWFILSYMPADQSVPSLPDTGRALRACAEWWHEWIARCQYRGRWEDQVKRSLITLKALTFEPHGGMVAAPTTSLPEVPGGAANYDYRFCWLRDAAFALKVLLSEGYQHEAHAWCKWLLNAVQHDGHLHALYTVNATVVPEEKELPWLPGYQNSQPVRVSNAASRQYQLDVRGELIEVLHLARSYGLELHKDIWQLQCVILDQLLHRWREPDTGIWEFRTICDHLTHSKVLAWVAYDRSIRDAEKFNLPAPLDEWREQRDAIRADILQNGVDAEGGYFTQRYGSREVDASLLMIPLVGFLPADDPRMQATIARIEHDLCAGGLVRRYRSGDQANVEGMFLACSFWLADVYWLAGRRRDAEAVFTRLLGLCNDVGLLAEEYDIYKGQQLGNFPQGLSHLALISTARLLATGSESNAELT